MNKRGKSWHLIVTALLIVVFSFTALFGESYTYGDTKNVYNKGAEEIRFGNASPSGWTARTSPPLPSRLPSRTATL